MAEGAHGRVATVGSHAGVKLINAAVATSAAPTNATKPLMAEAVGYDSWTFVVDTLVAFVATVTFWGTISDPAGTVFVWFPLGTLTNAMTAPLTYGGPLTGVFANVSAYTSGTVNAYAFVTK